MSTDDPRTDTAESSDGPLTLDRIALGDLLQHAKRLSVGAWGGLLGSAFLILGAVFGVGTFVGRVTANHGLANDLPASYAEPANSARIQREPPDSVGGVSGSEHSHGVAPAGALSRVGGAEKSKTKPKNWLAFHNPDELFRYIRSLPPLEREPTIDSVYVGSWVHWSGVIGFVRQDSYEYIVGTYYDTTSSYAYLLFRPDQRPVVDPMRKGNYVSYDGHISGVDRIPISNVTTAFFVDDVTVRSLRPKQVRR